MPILERGRLRIDFSEAGSGDPLLLVHSSVSGKRQWKRLTQDLQPYFRVIAVDLFGYGETSPWNGETTQTIADQAGLVLGLVQDISGPVRIVGHSFGGAVALKAALMLGERASHLFLFEPTLFHLLAQNGRWRAYAEAKALRDFIKCHAKKEDWDAVAERFVEYWIGKGAWAATPRERQLAYRQLLRPNYYEWDCLDSDQATIKQLVAIPAKAMLAYSPGAPRASREIAQLVEKKCRNWSVARIPEGGHMAPLTHPDVVNPLIADFLREETVVSTGLRKQWPARSLTVLDLHNLGLAQPS